jgi:arylsulfatase A-like enzyme
MTLLCTGAGVALGAAGLHGHTLFQELVSVPLVMVGLESPAPGSVEDQPVSLTDVVPTLLAAAHLDHSDLPGRDLSGTPQDRLLRMWLDSSERPYYAARRRNWKLIVRPEGTFLFDLDADPAESMNLASMHTDIVRQIDPGPPKLAFAEERTDVELSEGQTARLRALGNME